MLSFLLLFDKRLEFYFLKLHPKFPRAQAKKTHWNLQHLDITTEKNLRIQCFEINIVLTFCWPSIEALAAFAF